MKRPSFLSYSKRLAASYILDWFVIFSIAALGGGIAWSKPIHRPFSLLDLSISYPIVKEQVPTEYLLCICGLAPAIIIVLVVLFFVPGPAYCRSITRSQILRLKFWEFEKGWAGFSLSIALAFFITQGSKNLFGKPRPDLLARCEPDLTDIASHVVGGFGQSVDIRWTLVDSSICTTTRMQLLNEGFRSFPSGHSSFSWCTMLYLTLFLCSKFQISIPYLSSEQSVATIAGLIRSENMELLPLRNGNRQSTEDDTDKRPNSAGSTALTSKELSLRNRAAAPPVHLLVCILTPLAVAVWICSTRFAEFYHHGFDILSGALIGILSAWFAFRWYHLPIQMGQGWAWGARSRERAFGIGVGTHSYVGSEGWKTASEGTNDVEAGIAGRGYR